MERKEPTLGGASPDRDEQQLDDQPALRTSASRPQSSSRSAPPPVSDETRGPGMVAVLALLVAIAGVGGSGYLMWQLTESQKVLADAEHRIAGLETRLNLNSDQSSQTVDEIQDKLKWADSEIRKLWGVSQDTNRKKITANEDALVVLKRQLSAVEKSAANATASASGVKRELQAQLDKLTNQLSQANEAVTKLKSSADQIESLSIDVQRVTQQLPGLRDLASRVKTNEEAVAAIDTYRRNTNNDILQLKRQISNASSGTAP
ncbi:hypothetical protein [Gilvimarinus polysaccharolyticus]|uniref:hypothetical protein n=1 Tax=Gilvimarinus polysaccharolyticus TaxID=863921 RepID=UPI0006738ABF|nr:hypothetical protein [Gilvimarinus polysaccharolyticus]